MRAIYLFLAIAVLAAAEEPELAAPLQEMRGASTCR